MSGPEYIASVHRFLKQLNIPEAKIEKITGMTVIASSKKPLTYRKASKEELTDLDCIHTMLIELNRKSGRYNYLTFIIRPKNIRDNKDDGKPYVIQADMLGEEEWSTEESEDDTVYRPDNYDRFNTSDFTDDEDDKVGDKVDKKAGENAKDKGEDTDDDNGDELASELADDSADEIADEEDDAGDHAADEDIDEGTDEDDYEDDEQADDEDEDDEDQDHAYYTADDTIESEE